MKKWEYKYVFDSSAMDRFVKGGKGSGEIFRKDIEDILNKFGEDGWELFSNDDNRDFIFKRLKE